MIKDFDTAYMDFNLQRDYPSVAPDEMLEPSMPEQTMPGRQEGDVMLAAGPSGTVSDAGATIGPTPRNPVMGGVADFVRGVRDLANEYEIKQFVPLLGGMGVGDLLMGKSPEELEEWAYGNAPMRVPEMTSVPMIKTGRKEQLADTMFLGMDAVGLGKSAGVVARTTAKKLGPKAAEMIIESAERLGAPVRGLGIVEPSKFNPKTELPKAVDIVANDPVLNTFLPQAQRAPSVALRLTKPEIQGTGGKGTLTVSDIGLVLEKSQLSLNNGKTLDPTNPKDLVKMVDSASAEAEYQMSQPISGATWYEDDVFQAFALGSKIVPELATNEPLRVMATAFAASTSYNKRASDNWSVAMRITEDMMKTGKVPSRNPDNGKLWGGTTGPIMEKQLNLHDFMMGAMGMDNYAEWLLTPHTVKEISEMKAASGLYKDSSIPGKASDMKMGAFIIGEKGGAFFLNLNGIKETTADKWFSRTYNRHTGTLTTGPLSDQGLVDTPRNESERSVMKVWNRSVAENMKLDEQANQAVLWYYEQSLYYNLGIKSARSESFSDGAKTLLNARGIPFTAAELAGARGRSNAGQVAAEPPSAAGAGNTVGVGQAAPAAPATTVKRGRGAPTSGAK